MDKIRLIIPSRAKHCNEVITGALMLRQQGWDVELEDCSREDSPFRDLPVVQAEYRGKKLLYDTWDGYHDRKDMRLGLDWCDYYFKRSFSQTKNQELFPEDAGKMYPLGLYYYVTYPGNPLQEPLWKAAVRPLLGKTPDRYFVPKVFEGDGDAPCGDPPKILFLARLWGREAGLRDGAVDDGREAISQSRIEIIRTLRREYGDMFIGGIDDSPLSREMAPDLIVPRELTERRHYLRKVHESDICISSMGLHGSIGGKTAEYVAAAKAIVHEEMCYSTTGDFRDGVNYLSFRTAQECVEAVAQLVAHPERIQAMKRANAAYYQQYLRPDVLVKNTLEIVDKTME